jgi:xylanolytic transcriptional activator XlnR
MLSNPLHRFASYHALPAANMFPTGHIPSNHMQGTGLDSLAHSSQYALQQLQRHIDVHQNPHTGRDSNSKSRQHPYSGLPGGGSGRAGVNGSGTVGPVRRRISRACDQCNQLRTKCDGQNPCAHCIGMKATCCNCPPAHFYPRVQSRL